MSTDISKLHLPRHKRYNWHLVFRHWRIARKTKLIAVALLVGLFIYVVDCWLNEMLRRMDVEAAHAGLVTDVFRLANFGAPGWTWSGAAISDNTDPQVRKPK